MTVTGWIWRGSLILFGLLTVLTVPFMDGVGGIIAWFIVWAIILAVVWISLQTVTRANTTPEGLTDEQWRRHRGLYRSKIRRMTPHQRRAWAEQRDRFGL